MIIPSKSPEPVRDLEYHRLEDDFKIDELYKDQETEDKIKEKVQEHEAKNRAYVLTLLEDLPDADIKPPDNVLFVCKINPITQDDDLELIFSRFGYIKSCQIIRDWKTKKSLQYAFIEYETVEACEQAYFKMNGVVIDERRIKVDFSQSVAKLWQNFRKHQGSAITEENHNELALPNESKKLEIKTNKNFMIHSNKLDMVFDNPEEEPEIDINIGKEKKKQKEHRKSRSTSRHKKHKHRRSRSSSRHHHRSKHHRK
jgi:peptidyl-prolyl cis-trans isomerase-like 4